MNTENRTDITSTKTNPSTSSPDRELVITRLIDAPPERVFQAWTDSELLKQK